MLEVCVDSLESARNALTGGADRLEVCSSLNVGGLTPSIGLLKAIRNEFPEAVLFVKLQCRLGDYRYSEDELTTMLYDLQELKYHGANGFVFGALSVDRRVDRAACERVVAAARPLPVTFHRAFDLCVDTLEALETIINMNFRRILTSGNRTSAANPLALDVIRLLMFKSKQRIIIMAGAGIDHNNISELMYNGIREAHGSFKKKKFEDNMESVLLIECKNEDDSEKDDSEEDDSEEHYIEEDYIVKNYIKKARIEKNYIKKDHIEKDYIEKDYIKAKPDADFIHIAADNPNPPSCTLADIDDQSHINVTNVIFSAASGIVISCLFLLVHCALKSFELF